MFSKQNQRLVFTYDAEQLWIEPWGPNALRVRATKQAEMPLENWAPQMEVGVQTDVMVTIEEKQASIANGKIKAVVSAAGKLMIYNRATNKLLLEEYARNRTCLIQNVVR